MNMLMKVDILNYESPRTPKKASKRRTAKTDKLKSAFKSKAKINAKAGKHQRDNIGNDVNEEKKKE
jgi:hypothetical protein